MSQRYELVVAREIGEPAPDVSLGEPGDEQTPQAGGRRALRVPMGSGIIAGPRPVAGAAQP